MQYTRRSPDLIGVTDKNRPPKVAPGFVAVNKNIKGNNYRIMMPDI